LNLDRRAPGPYTTTGVFVDAHLYMGNEADVARTQVRAEVTVSEVGGYTVVEFDATGAGVEVSGVITCPLG